LVCLGGLSLKKHFSVSRCTTLEQPYRGWVLAARDGSGAKMLAQLACRRPLLPKKTRQQAGFAHFFREYRQKHVTFPTIFAA
jgi:hypothetical protein